MQQVVLNSNRLDLSNLKIFVLNFIQSLSSLPPLSPPPLHLPRAQLGRIWQGTVTRMCVNFREKNRMCVNYRNQISKVVYIKILTCSAPSTWVSKRHWVGQRERRMKCRGRREPETRRLAYDKTRVDQSHFWVKLPIFGWIFHLAHVKLDIIHFFR